MILRTEKSQNTEKRFALFKKILVNWNPHPLAQAAKQYLFWIIAN
jgi:hypothetical protein